MAGRHSSKRSRRSSSAKARRHRAIGMAGGAGTFLALGLAAPAAHADEFDLITYQTLSNGRFSDVWKALFEEESVGEGQGASSGDWAR